MGEFADGLSDTFKRLNAPGWGIGDIAGCPWPAAAGFKRALSLLFPYQYRLDGYRECEFHHLLLEKQLLADTAVAELCAFLERLGIRHFPVPGGQDQVRLESVFPHKYAATRAGLGWIGRNSLLVTPEWGPRVFIRTILLDSDIDPAEPVNASRCGDCRVCVDACPYGCISGREWAPGMDRAELIDVFTCNRARLDAIPELGHKDACGFCLLACPSGNDGASPRASRR